MVVEEEDAHGGTSSVPLDEVLGEAEARFGRMPACLRDGILPLLADSKSKTESKSESLGSSNNVTNNNKESKLKTSHNHEEAGRNAVNSFDGGGISLDDIALVPMSSTDMEVDDHGGRQNTADDILANLDEDKEGEARRSPDSGCSMSEASADDKISIASTGSSDDFGASRIDRQIQRLKYAMHQLREQDVALARQLLIVYDYVEETKWFLENYETCDSHKHESMTPTERRFSQNFQKRLSDYGVANPKGLSVVEFKRPAWMDINDTTPKRHSRNVSDGQIDVAQLRRHYHDNNNNSTSIADLRSGMQNATTNGDILNGSSRSSRDSAEILPRTMGRRSVSASMLELRLHTTTAIDISCLPQRNPLSPVMDSGKTTPDAGDQDCHVEPSLSNAQEVDAPVAKISHVRTNEESVPSEVISLAAPLPEVKTVRFNLVPENIPGNRSSTSSSSSASSQSEASSPSPNSADEDGVVQNCLSSSTIDSNDVNNGKTRASSPPSTHNPDLQNASSSSVTHNDAEIARQDSKNEGDVEPPSISTTVSVASRNKTVKDYPSPTDSITVKSCEPLKSSSSAHSTGVDHGHTRPVMTSSKDLPPPSKVGTDDFGDDCDIYVDDDDDDEEEEEDEQGEAPSQSDPTSPSYKYMTWINDQDETLL